MGGQIQSVTVQPKANVPAYELQPSDLARSRPRTTATASRTASSASGTLRFF